ncbi:MAG: subclass B1 metallo-beta-lactamase [Bacteroidota bacterium]|nr:subclass B1 metallo-beta-lactamase [Bacteroidota bacterium]
MKKFLLFLALLGLMGCKKSTSVVGYETPTLKIEPLTEQSYLHVSYLETESFGKVACNGMIVVNDGEAIVFDTPVNNEVSEELLKWLKSKDLHVKAVVATHFHDDCLGGLEVFHANQIASYANQKTIELVQDKDVTIPNNGFSKTLELLIGNETVVLDFMGEGHTVDNIIGYFPKDQTMFGGCLIKSVGASKGYIEDANIKEWSQTVKNIKAKYPKTMLVVPGHGQYGDKELLDYTIALFK